MIRLIRGSELFARSGDSESARTYYRYPYDAWGKIEVKEETIVY